MSSTRRRPVAAAATPGVRLPTAALPVAAVVGLSAAMNTYALSQNGYANGFYSAGVKSMLLSLHNLLFVSSDPGGLISIDKPPLALWVQVASAKVFGFGPMSVLLPEAIAGALAVLVLYLAMARPFGRPAALAGALALAVFPAFVAVSRDNNPDALLILLMVASCGLALSATRTGSLRMLLVCALAVGLAFNVKALAAYLVVPGVALAFLACAPGSLPHRAAKLVAAGVVVAVVSLAWLVFVDLTPATKRPYVGSTRDNSEISLAFKYNGLGRISGQGGGPGAITNREGAFVPPSPAQQARAAARRRGERKAKFKTTLLGPLAVLSTGFPMQASPPAAPSGSGAPSSILAPKSTPGDIADGRAVHPAPFAKRPGPMRLLEKGLGTQAGWLLPLALLGIVAILVEIALDGIDTPKGRHRHHRARLAGVIVLGGWMLTEAVFLSFAKGIVHPYYTSELAPGVAAMAGAGVFSMAALARRGRGWVALLALALAGTIAAQVDIAGYAHYMHWLPYALPVCGGVAVVAVLARRSLAMPAVCAVFALLLVAPTAFSAATWGAPVQGTFPVAGPWGSAGFGGVDARPDQLVVYRSLVPYLASHRPGSRFSVLTVSSVTSASLILMGSRAASLAGYSGTDPALHAGGLAHMVEDGEARYVLLGGPYSSRGGNSASRGALAVCRRLPYAGWGGVRESPYSFALLDCAGRARRLAAAG